MYYGNLGSLLHEMRTHLGKTIDEVSKDCNISKTYIINMENNELDKLPSYTHSKNFVSKYSEYLGFDYNKDIKHLFNNHFVDQGEKLKD